MKILVTAIVALLGIGSHSAQTITRSLPIPYADGREVQLDWNWPLAPFGTIAEVSIEQVGGLGISYTISGRTNQAAGSTIWIPRVHLDRREFYVVRVTWFDFMGNPIRTATTEPLKVYLTGKDRAVELAAPVENSAIQMGDIVNVSWQTTNLPENAMIAIVVFYIGSPNPDIYEVTPNTCSYNLDTGRLGVGYYELYAFYMNEYGLFCQSDSTYFLVSLNAP